LSASSTGRLLGPGVFYLIVTIVFLADQISKTWVQRILIPDAGSQPIVGQAFLLTLTHNTGGAWGLLPHGNVIFIVFALLAVIALLFAYHWMRRVDLLVGAAFALALGGALGNLLDRLRYGFVVDFFEARIIHWPIFNIADSAITVGILLLLVHFFRTARDERYGVTSPLARDEVVSTPRE
jgi:signal peptidase II